MTSITETLRQSVVVFSQNYLPINRVNLKRAIVLLVTGKAEPVEFIRGNYWEFRSPSLILRVPEQIRLTLNCSERIWKTPPVNRREILRRDNHCCQYCGSRKHLTIDHVLPRSRGGTHSWDNVVIACMQCNSIKGDLLAAAPMRDRTLQETGMVLHHQPKAPMHPTIAFAEKFWREQQFKDGMTGG